MKVDLHCHTTASDGRLAPEELLKRAEQQGVELLAITDHDTLNGYLSLANSPVSSPVKLIPGIEFSSVWAGVSVHIVGLGLDQYSQVLSDAIDRQTNAREARAEMIGKRLAKRGCSDAYAGAKQIAGESQIGRPHFARYMVASGFVDSVGEAFAKYLGSGKLGDVKAQWPAMEEVVDWIIQAGGIPVLAHPGKYSMTNTKLRLLIDQFKASGGLAVEVVSGLQNRDKTAHFARLCHEYQLAASLGSDFHGPPSDWSDIGKMSALPEQCLPVMELLDN